MGPAAAETIETTSRQAGAATAAIISQAAETAPVLAQDSVEGTLKPAAAEAADKLPGMVEGVAGEVLEGEGELQCSFLWHQRGGVLSLITRHLQPTERAHACWQQRVLHGGIFTNGIRRRVRCWGRAVSCLYGMPYCSVKCPWLLASLPTRFAVNLRSSTHHGPSLWFFPCASMCLLSTHVLSCCALCALCILTAVLLQHLTTSLPPVQTPQLTRWRLAWSSPHVSWVQAQAHTALVTAWVPWLLLVRL